MKFYTEEGNWDLVGNNTPIFFNRDPFQFISFIHSQKRNPVTHLKDPDMFWDYLTLRPESMHQVFFLFSDRGIPDGFRHMNGYGSHTFKFVNSKGVAYYCKFHMKTDQGIRNILPDKAEALSGSKPDYAIRDLYNAIAEGQCPTWTVYVQIMTFEQAETYRYNPFDVTKVWSQKEFPLIPVGKITLDRNPKNYFAEIEQLAFAPSNLVPGIEPSPDKMLQGRLFAYTDTHVHRLGTNFLQIPVNCPFRTRVANYRRDGPQTVDNNQGGAPNYFPNSFSGPVDNPKYKEPSFKVSGDVNRYNSANDDNFSQVTDFWSNVLNAEERSRLVSNFVDSLTHTQDFIQDRAVKIFYQVHPDVGRMVAEGLRRSRKSPTGRL